MAKIIPSSIVLFIAFLFSSASLCLEVPLKEGKVHTLLGLFYQKHYPPNTYTGSFKIDGVNYTIKITDFNHNGKINDRPKVLFSPKLSNVLAIYRQADIVTLSMGEKTDYSDGQILGDLLLLGGRLFEARIDNENKKMILDEVKNGLFPLKLTIKLERLSLISENGRCLMAYKPLGNILMLPPGKYRLLDYQVIRSDSQSGVWRLKAEGTSKSPLVTVGPGANEVLTIGEPLTPIVTPIRIYNGTLTAKDAIRLSFTVEGVGKEILTDLRSNKRTLTSISLFGGINLKNRPKEPTYTIMKPDGGIVAKGSFEYG